MKFRKMLAMVLAVAMIASLVPLVGTTAKADVNDPYYGNLEKENPTWYGGNKYEGKLDIEIKEVTTGPYVVGDHIEIQVIVKNISSEKVTGKTLKIHHYNTNDQELNSINPNTDITSKGDGVDYLNFTFVGYEHSGVTAGEVKQEKLQLTYKKDFTIDVGGSITLTYSFDITADDLGKVLKNYVCVYVDSTKTEQAIGKYIQSSFDKVVDKDNDVGKVTIKNTVTSGDTGRLFDYIVTLSDKSVNEKLGDVTFTNGVGKFSLKNGEQKLIDKLVAGTEYTVEESNYTDYTVSNSVDTNEHGNAETVNGYTVKGTASKNSEATIEFINKQDKPSEIVDPLALTYYLNIGPDANVTFVDHDADIRNEDAATYSLRGFGEDKNDYILNNKGEENKGKPITFDGVTGQANLSTGKYDLNGTTYYFAGWCTTKAKADSATTYDQIDYPVTKLDDDLRNFAPASRPTHIVKKTDDESSTLYAVWFKNPGMVGYAMTHEGARFTSMQIGTTVLGDNGKTNTNTKEDAESDDKPHAQKYVVWNDGGHSYDKSAQTGDPFTVTTARPYAPDGYNFLGWFVKNANKASSTAKGFEGLPDPNKSYIAMPGSTVYYGAVETIYSLDALWGRLTGGASVVVPYDGAEHTVDVTGDHVIKAEFPATSISKSESGDAYNAYNAFFANDTLTVDASSISHATSQKGTDSDTNIKNEYIQYSVSVHKQGDEDGTYDEDVDLSESEHKYLPTRTVPGVYEYTITAKLVIDNPTKGKDPSYSGGSVTMTVGTVSAILVILPQIEVEITKEITGRTFKPGDEFKFDVAVSGPSTLTVNSSTVTISGAADKKGTAAIKLSPTIEAGTYTVTVKEQDVTEPGMVEAEDKTFTFRVNKDSSTGAVTVSDFTGDCGAVTGTSTGYTVPITMTNEYKTGSLTLTNKIIPAETDPQQPFTFTVQFADSAGLDFLNVSSTTHGSGADDTFTFDQRSKKATITIKDTGTVTITGIPVGASYTVTEEDDHPNFDSSLITDPESGKGAIAIDDLDQTVEIENFYVMPESLTIHKTVTNDKFMTQSDREAANNTGFTVEVKLTGSGLTDIKVDGTSVKDKDDSDGDVFSFDVTLTDCDSAVITGIPAVGAGTGYTVTETSTGTSTGTYTTTYSNGSAGGTTGSASGTVTSGGSANVVITNKYNSVTSGSLKIEKKIEGNSLTKPDNATEFDVQVTLSDYNGIQLTGVNTFGGTTFTNGVATVKVSVNTSVTITGLPQGLQYKVEEINVPVGASVSYGSNQNGTIGTGETTVTVTNTYEVDDYDLTISNIVVGADTGTTQKFTITMDERFKSFQYQVNSGRSESSTGNEVTNIELGDGDTVTILDVPVGTTYSVVETDTASANYTSFSIGASPMPKTMARTVTEPNSTGTMTLNADTTVSYINAYTGTLKLQVKLDGEGDWPNKDKSATFKFEIRIVGADTFTGTVNTLDFVNGVATVELTVGAGAESASKSWAMPANTTYTVTETINNGAKTVTYKVGEDSINQTTVESLTTSAVIVTNTYEKSIVPPTSGPGDGGGSGGPGGGPGGNGTDPDDGGDGPGDVIDRSEHFGYIIGVAPGQVRPDQNITRAEIATIIFRLLTDEAREANWSENSGFADVKSGDWYNHAVAVLYNLGIIKGKEDGLFHPNDMITRAELATMLARFYDEPQNTVLTNRFIDVEPDKWFTDYVLRADYYGLMQGDGNRFKPEDLLTRAEAMTAFNRLLGRKPHKDHLCEGMITWIDNSDKSKWYYAAVQEATNSHECGDDVTVDGVTYETWLKITPMRDWAALEY